MICWCCHSYSVNTGSRLPICSDVRTRKGRKVVGIDMIRNNRIGMDQNNLLSCIFFYYTCSYHWVNLWTKWNPVLQIFQNTKNNIQGKIKLLFICQLFLYYSQLKEWTTSFSSKPFSVPKPLFLVTFETVKTY